MLKGSSRETRERGRDKVKIKRCLQAKLICCLLPSPRNPLVWPQLGTSLWSAEWHCCPPLVMAPGSSVWGGLLERTCRDVDLRQGLSSAPGDTQIWITPLSGLGLKEPGCYR